MTIAIGIDAKVEIGRGATPTWTELAYVTDITLPEFTRDKIEVTHQKSPSGKKEYIPGLGEFSDMTAAMHYVPGSATDDLCLNFRTPARLSKFASRSRAKMVQLFRLIQASCRDIPETSLWAM